MIARDSRHHRASYDDDGNIILPNDGRAEPKLHEIEPLEEASQPAPTSAAPPKPQPAPQPEPAPQPIQKRPSLSSRSRHIWQGVRSAVYETTSTIVIESRDQVRASREDIKQVAHNLQHTKQKAGSGLRSFLLQPVWVVKPNKKPRQFNRLSLFFFDVVRFGGTFALIFLLLFVGMNYQSFWQIAREKIDPVHQAQQMQAESAAIDGSLTEKILKTPSLAVAGSEGGVLDFLPEVGPPDNRIIIPKLGLNVPLVNPPVQSLLEENWEQVETDIQDALQHGVVHYPGTARPGQAGNFFVTGHSSYYPWAQGDYKTVFARLHNLEPGDEYYVYFGGDEHRYVVQSKREVKPNNVDVLDQPVDRRISTLMTCTPVGTTLRRLILVAQEVDPATGKPMAVGEQHKREHVPIHTEELPI